MRYMNLLVNMLAKILKITRAKFFSILLLSKVMLLVENPYNTIYLSINILFLSPVGDTLMCRDTQFGKHCVSACLQYFFDWVSRNFIAFELENNKAKFDNKVLAYIKFLKVYRNFCAPLEIPGGPL